MNPVHTTAPEGAPARVLHIGSRRIVRPLLGEDATFQHRFDWLKDEVADQLAHAISSPLDDRPLHLVCTTTLSKMVSGWEHNARALFAAVQSRTGLRPGGMLEGYQCTGWGFALRFAALHTTHRWLLLSIADADLHECMSGGYEDAIGGIGFGATTVSLDLAGIGEVPHCGGPFPNHGLTDLLHAVRAQLKRRGPRPTFLPFLPDGLAGVVRRTVGDSVGPNRHDHHGHTFGSDPWIGLAEWLLAHPPAAEQDVTLGAFAYDGYVTTGSVRVGPYTRVDLREDAANATPSPESQR